MTIADLYCVLPDNVKVGIYSDHQEDCYIGLVQNISLNYFNLLIKKIIPTVRPEIIYLFIKCE